jgi:hypothetical protein
MSIFQGKFCPSRPITSGIAELKEDDFPHDTKETKPLNQQVCYCTVATSFTPENYVVFQQGVFIKRVSNSSGN